MHAGPNHCGARRRLRRAGTTCTWARDCAAALIRQTPAQGFVPHAPCTTAAALAAAAVVVAAAAALAAAAAPAEAAAGGQDGAAAADAAEVLPPAGPLARYLEKVIPDGASARQWLAEHAPLLPPWYREGLLASSPSLASRTGAAPPAASGQAAPALPDASDVYDGETFAYGSLRSASPGGAVRAQPGATVCLVDRPAAGSFEPLLDVATFEPACRITDANGTFWGHIFAYNDRGDPVDLWLNVSASNGGGRVVDGTGRTHAAYVDVADELDGYLTGIGAVSAGGMGRAFWILDSVSIGREAARSATGLEMPPLDVRWLNDTRSRVPSSYDGAGMNMTVSSSVKRGAVHGGEAYPASILREYGHHVMRAVYAASGSAHPDSGTCTNTIVGPASPACAWAAGWANFFSALAVKSPILQHHEQRYPIDLEAAKWRVRGQSGAGFADGSAGRVASALWDLHDPANEGGDTVDNATVAVWAALGGAPASFADFAGNWSRAGDADRPPLGSVMALNGLASIPSQLAASPAASRFYDGFESGAGAWVMSGAANWRAAPGEGRNGSHALVSSGCGGGGCVATLAGAVSATGYARASLNVSLSGGPSSVVHLQHSADGASWASVLSHNGSAAGWRSIDANAVRTGGGGGDGEPPVRAYFRLVAFSPAATHSAAIDGIVVRADSPPTFVAPPAAVRVGHDRLQELSVAASDPDGDAVSLSLEVEARAAREGVSAVLRDHGNGTGTVEVRAAPSSAGNYTASVAASAHGLSSSVPLAIAVDDVEPPSIRGDTGDRTVEAAGLSSTPVALDPVSAADNHDPRPALHHNRSSGGAYPLGTTIIKYSAEDSAGNTASVLQRITVSDTTPPAFGAAGTISARLGLDRAPAAVDYEKPAAADLGAPVPVRCSPPPGSVFRAGTTTVTCTASDGRGNIASISFNVSAAAPLVLRGPSSPVPVSAYRIDNPRGIDVAEFEGSTYAAVAHSYPVWWYYDGVAIVNITDPHRPVHVSSARDGHGGFGSLGGARDVALARVGGGLYAAVVSAADGAIQVVNLTIPADPSPASSIAVPRSSDAGGPGPGAAIVSFESGQSTYVAAAVPGYGGRSGVYIVDITDPASPSLASSAVDGAAGFGTLAGASGIDVARIGGSTYAVVASYADNGIQVVNITDPRSPAAVASAVDGAAGFAELAGAASVAVARIGESTYAVVASAADDGIQVVDITNPAAPAAVGRASDGAAGFDKLDAASGVAIAGIGGGTYAVVAAPDTATSGHWYAANHPDNGVQIVNITNPAAPSPVASLADGAAGFGGLYTPGAVAVAAVGPALYALASSFYDDAVQVIGIGAARPNLPPVVPAIPDATVLETGRLRHGVGAHDPNGDRVSVAVHSSPPAPGLALSGEGGAVEWTPGESQSGRYLVNVTAADPHGGSAGARFALTVLDASVSRLAHGSFSSSLDGWAYKQVWNPVGDRTCGPTASVVQYGISRSAERGGSAHVSGNAACWKGTAGAARSVAVPQAHDGGDMRIDLEFRALGTIYRTGSWSNNLEVIVAESSGRVLAWESLYASQRVPGQDDSGWRSATVYAKGINASACPCEAYVYMTDYWEMNHRQNFYLDNVNITVAKAAAGAAAVGAAGAGEAAAARPARNSLTIGEALTMAQAGGTRVVITEKIIGGTSVSLAWNPHAGMANSLYDIVAAPEGGGGEAEAAAAVLSAVVRGTSGQIGGLEPGTRYEISVGVHGEPQTRSAVWATAGG